jgi:hypothetical protein
VLCCAVRSSGCFGCVDSAVYVLTPLLFPHPPSFLPLLLLLLLLLDRGSHVHGFIGITRSKNRELFDQIQKTCPEGVREFRNGYVANTRHATLTFQFPDLMLSEEERSLDEFGPEACRIMDSLLSKEVFFEVLWSPRWGRFVAHNVVVIS